MSDEPKVGSITVSRITYQKIRRASHNPNFKDTGATFNDDGTVSVACSQGTLDKMAQVKSEIGSDDDDFVMRKMLDFYDKRSR